MTQDLLDLLGSDTKASPGDTKSLEPRSLVGTGLLTEADTLLAQRVTGDLKDMDLPASETKARPGDAKSLEPRFRQDSIMEWPLFNSGSSGDVVIVAANGPQSPPPTPRDLNVCVRACVTMHVSR